jgi:hypothetical protein
VPRLTEAASQNQRPRCPNLTEAAAPIESPGARVTEAASQNQAEGRGGELEDDFDADSEPEDAATRWDNVGAAGCTRIKNSESRVKSVGTQFKTS